MSIPSDVQPVDNNVVAPAAPAAVPQVKADDHWPVCRCTHPMHPHAIEVRRGVRLERYHCPRRRWWNHLLHPAAWQPPRE